MMSFIVVQEQGCRDTWCLMRLAPGLYAGMTPSTKCMCALDPLPPWWCTTTLPLMVRLIFSMLMVHAPSSAAHAKRDNRYTKVVIPRGFTQAGFPLGQPC